MIELLLNKGKAKCDLINMEKKAAFEMIDKDFLKEIKFDILTLSIK